MNYYCSADLLRDRGHHFLVTRSTQRLTSIFLNGIVIFDQQINVGLYCQCIYKYDGNQQNLVHWKVDVTQRNMQDLLSCHPYLCNSFLPAFNDLVPSNRELEGLVSVSRGVKLLSILQRACHKQLQWQHKIMVETRTSDQDFSFCF